jgi:flagellar biosynthesis component FlhA
MQTSLKEHLSPLLESNSIDKMVESECNSIVDVRYGNSISSASEVEETQLLIGQVKRLYDALLTEKSKGTYLQKILAYENKQQQLGHNQLSTPSAP